MMEAALVIIKPDGISKGLVGDVLNKFARAKLSIIAIRAVKTNRKLAEEHYKHIKDRPFFNDTVSYFLGKYHKEKYLLSIIYYGNGAIRKCRKIAGATNPEEAEPASIRGSYGCITDDGIYENVVHVSSDKKEAEREIKLWFNPDDCTTELYPTKLETVEDHRERVWK